jgi:hypothetical protein
LAPGTLENSQDKAIAYKSLEGYIVELSSDTITFTMLLPDLKAGNYSITN